MQNAQRRVAVSGHDLQKFAAVALSLVWTKRRPEAEISSVSAITVSLISDERMARLHQQFSGLSGPTDVLTFHHGEIIISAETAARQARAFGSSTERELRLYIVHGLLHLCGYDDRNAQARARMERLQREVLRAALRNEGAAAV